MGSFEKRLRDCLNYSHTVSKGHCLKWNSKTGFRLLHRFSCAKLSINQGRGQLQRQVNTHFVCANFYKIIHQPQLDSAADRMRIDNRPTPNHD